MDKLLNQLKKHEGFKSNYYQCTADKKTIGYGRNVSDNPFTSRELLFLGRCKFDEEPIKEYEATILLMTEVSVITSFFSGVCYYEALNEPRKAVVVNMMFNLGAAGFGGFKKMIAAIDDCFYEKAAKEMLDSKWANQVGKEKGQRAYELSEQMRTGEWQ